MSELDVNSHKPLTPLGDLLTLAWKAWKKRALPLLLVQLCGFLFFVLGVGPIAAGAWFGTRQYSQYQTPILISAIVVGLLVLLIISAWIWAAMIVASLNEVSFKQALSSGKELMSSFIGLFFMGGLVVFGGMTLVVLPGIIMMVWFSLGGFVLAAEAGTATASLARSRALVRGHFWAVAGRLFVASVLSTMVGLIPVIGQLLSTSAFMVFLAVVFQDIRSCNHETHSKVSKGSLMIPMFLGLVGLLYIPTFALWKNGWKLPKFEQMSQKMSEVTFQPAALPEGFSSNWGSKGTVPGKLNSPSGITADKNGNIYICDQNSPGNIQKFSNDGRLLARWDKTEGVSLFFLVALVVDNAGWIHISDPGFHRVFTIDSEGRFKSILADSGIDTDGKVNGPAGLAIDGENNVLIADSYNHRIQKFKQDGTFVLKIGSKGDADGQFQSPVDVATDKEGRVWVADSELACIQIFSPDGKFLARWGKRGENPGELYGPSRIAVDLYGYVYVGESMRLQKFDPNGVFVREWKAVSYEKPEFNIADLSIDASGNLLVLDSANGRVMKVETSGPAAPELQSTALPEPVITPAPEKPAPPAKKKKKKRSKKSRR